MGLDQYLHKNTYVGAKWSHRNVDGNIKVTVDGEELPIDFKRVTTITEEVGYWRKSNAIHQWFVDNVQSGVDDCREYYVSVDQLQELLDIIYEISEDHSKAEELLPSQQGFFFGGTDYDDWYFDDLEATKKILNGAINEGGSYYYSSSW